MIVTSCCEVSAPAVLFMPVITILSEVIKNPGGRAVYPSQGNCCRGQKLIL